MLRGTAQLDIVRLYQAVVVARLTFVLLVKRLLEQSVDDIH